LFATEKFPIDLVALMVLTALLALRLVTPEQAISGLNNPATVTVACMFVLSAGLQRTGAVKIVGRVIVRYGKNPLVLLLLIMVVVGAASAFINNTGGYRSFSVSFDHSKSAPDYSRTHKKRR
jgi:di/tricarboxylate transporter